MGTETSRHFPHAFDGIEIGAIRRKEIEFNSLTKVMKPGLQNGGMVMTGVIDDQDHFSIRTSVSKNDSQECLESLRVERFPATGDQAPVGRANGAEDGHRFPSRSMVENRIDAFRRNPHHTPGPMLLKMTFIGEPQVNVSPSGQFSEFFYMRPWPPGRPGPSGTSVFFVGIPVDGRVSDTAGPPSRSDTVILSDGRGVCRPKASADSLKGEVLFGGRARRIGDRSPLKPRVARSALLLGARRNRDLGNGESSIGPSGGSVPKERRYHRSSSRHRRGERREADDRSGTLRISGFRFGWPVS